MKQVRNPLLLFVPLACVLLLAIAILNRNTPFRGEHWAMLYAWVDAGSWFGKLSKVVNIEYFGDHRFQPLNSAPMILGYLLFGMRFFPYLLVSLLLQVLLAFNVIRLLQIYRNPKECLTWRELLQKYPLEFSLFLVFFPGMEVLFWTYYHYIQIATILAVFGMGSYLRNASTADRCISYLSLVSASLFYEPFLLALVILVFCNGFRKIKSEPLFYICDFALPVTLCVAVGMQYVSGVVGKPVTVPPDVSVLNDILLQPGHNELFRAAGAFNKILFVLYNQLLLIIHLGMSTLVPAFAHRTNLYEMMPINPTLEAFLPFALFAASGAYVFYFRRLGLKHHLALLIVGVCSGVIIWGRPGSGHYPSTQFRYAYIILPILFVVALDLLHKTKMKPKVLTALLIYLFTVNSASSLAHGFRLKRNFQSYSSFILDQKARGASSDQIVKDTAKAILDLKIPAQGYDAFLIYNGRGAMAKFYRPNG